jgi:hypothetical protein
MPSWTKRSAVNKAEQGRFGHYEHSSIGTELKASRVSSRLRLQSCRHAISSLQLYIGGYDFFHRRDNVLSDGCICVSMIFAVAINLYQEGKQQRQIWLDWA